MATEADQSNIISEGAQVIFKRNDVMKVVQIRPKRMIFMEKSKFVTDGIVGHLYGTTFKVEKGTLLKTERTDVHADIDIDEESGADNRHLVDERSNQKLSKEEIQKMKKKCSGQDIIGQLVENSATFKNKTEFAQQKYIKKKKKKYVPHYTVLKPTARLLAQMYYMKGPSKICNMRMDSLSQILCHGNIRAGSKVMVTESCVGLLLGAVMEHMGGHGTVVQFYNGTAPSRPALESFDFPKHFYQNLHAYPLNLVNFLGKGSTPDKSKATSEQADRDMPDTVNTSSYSISPKSSSVPEISNQTVESSHSADLKSEQTGQSEGGAEGKASGVESTDLDCDREGQKDSSASGEEADEDTEMQEEEDKMARKKGTHKSPIKKGEKRGKRKELTEEEKLLRKQRRQEHLRVTKEIIEKASFDCLIVASRSYPTPIVEALVKFVAPSRPVVVFCPFKEPLLDCYTKLKDSGVMVLMKLTETWLREYQVLPGRTHPAVNMSNSGGYLLTGTRVMPDS